MYRYAHNRLVDAQTAATVACGMVLTNLLCRQDMVVHANDALLVKADRAMQSAIVAPDVTGGPELDLAAQTVMAAGSLELVRHTASPGEVIGMAAAAQAVSCAADVVVERAGWLTATERAQEDVGFSAIFSAWMCKYLFDKLESAKDTATKRRRILGLGGFVAGMTAVIPLAEGAQGGGKLDFVAHSAGLAVGAAAHWRDRRKATAALI